LHTLCGVAVARRIALHAFVQESFLIILQEGPGQILFVGGEDLGRCTSVDRLIRFLRDCPGCVRADGECRVPLVDEKKGDRAPAAVSL